MICLQFSGVCLLYATTQRSLSQMFPRFNLCFAAGCRSSRLCVSAEGWSFRPLRASWGMLSHSSIPPVPTTLWESCLGENNWSCRSSHTWFTVRKRTSGWNPHRQNSSVKQSIQRLSSSHRAVVDTLIYTETKSECRQGVVVTRRGQVSRWSGQQVKNAALWGI